MNLTRKLAKPTLALDTHYTSYTYTYTSAHTITHLSSVNLSCEEVFLIAIYLKKSLQTSSNLAIL